MKNPGQGILKRASNSSEAMQKTQAAEELSFSMDTSKKIEKLPPRIESAPIPHHTEWEMKLSGGRSVILRTGIV